MARPRVFVSSTYYDLKHLRSSLENFIEKLGYEAVLSEKDRIAYLPDVPLDESCYREARSCDIFVLIIGGRYGAEASSGRAKKSNKKDFFERYESITKQEYQNACDRSIPTFICIDASVEAEYQTYQKNKDKKGIVYAHVDSVNIFHFIEFVRDQQKNNPIKLFSRYSEIEDWLREQWAGFFREMISRLSHQKEIEDVNKKINDLSATTETLKRYAEQIIQQVSESAENSKKLIEAENLRLKSELKDIEFRSIPYIKHLSTTHKLSAEKVRANLKANSSYQSFLKAVFDSNLPTCAGSFRAFSELNEAREQIGLKEFGKEEFDQIKAIIEKRRSEKKKDLATS